MLKPDEDGWQKVIEWLIELDKRVEDLEDWKLHGHE